MKKIAILATDGFEQSELFEPMQAFKDAGHQTEIISIKSGKIKGWKDGKWGKTIAVNKLASEAKASIYDAIVVPGGVMNPDKLRMNKPALKLLKDMNKAGKPVATICHAPWSLIDAGLVSGRTITSYPSIKTDLINAGANWVNKTVAIDDNLITSRNPDDIPAFNKAILKMLETD